jgi:DeoR family transcriptional regulator, aga operon transcriptional repressor
MSPGRAGPAGCGPRTQWDGELGPARLTDASAPAEVRQERITTLVREQGFARVVDLGSRFEVSAVTIRSDLQSLETRGRVRRIRGGAVASGALHVEQPFEVAESDLAIEKAQIGSCAARVVTNGDAVVIDVGTTTTAVARALVARSDLRDVTVMTNALNVALELERAWPRISVVVTAARVRCSTPWSTPLER